jgi:hypothetical protein
MISSPQFNDSHKMILKRVPTSPWKGFGFELQDMRITYGTQKLQKDRPLL